MANMYLTERLWAVVTTIVNVITLSPVNDGAVSQLPLDLLLPGGHDQSLAVPPKVEVATGPIFRPPGTSNSNFFCNYSSMTTWEACSTPMDRTCWLRNTVDPSLFNIYTDYENSMPNGTTRVYNLTLTDEMYDKDGELFPDAKLFNKLYPGPLIEACWGDQVIVNVTNRLKHNGTSVHWHGIRQLLNMQMDGVNGVTQCPIAPGDSMEYSWTVMQYGSSWYHSHYSVQYADGAAGPMTLHGPTSASFDEAVDPLIMTDWGHNSAFNAVLGGLLDPNILLNGRGNITQYDGVQNTTEIQPLYEMAFEEAESNGPIKRYHVRIINTSFQSTFIFSIDNHILEVISTDFVPIHPYRNTTVLVGIGQRYDLIVEARPQLDPNNPESELPTDGNYWIRMTMSKCDAERPPPENEYYDQAAILRYNNQSTASPTSQRWTNFSRDCSDETYASLHPVVAWQVGPPVNDLQVFTVDFGGGGLVPNFPLASARLYQDKLNPSIRVNYTNVTMMNLENTGDWNQSWRMVVEDKSLNSPEPSWVYLVLVGSNHPIHLHGHDFAILNQSFTPWEDSAPGFRCGEYLNCDNPPRRDVVLIPEKGYAVIAFKEDNPGAWLVHCHIAFHIAFGLGMQVLEDRSVAAQLWPANGAVWNETQRVCNNWQAWYNNTQNWAPQDCTGIMKQFRNIEYCFQDDSGV